MREKTGVAVGVYEYDKLPDHFRSQLRQICDKAIGPYQPAPGSSSHNANGWWETIDTNMKMEVEAYAAYGGGAPNRYEQLCDFLRLHQDVDDWLMLIQLIGQQLVNLEKVEVSIDPKATQHRKFYRGATLYPRDAIDEINKRFEQHSLGYRFENEHIIRISDAYMHTEVMEPALALLQVPGFETANEDFMTAHQHHMARAYKDVTTSGLRAFESTLKAICVARGWKYESGDRATELITRVRRENLFPDMGKGFDSYVAMMKTGLPGLRNAHGGHGSGPDDPAPPEYIAQYALDLTAANVRMLIEAYKELPAMPGIT